MQSIFINPESGLRVCKRGISFTALKSWEARSITRFNSSEEILIAFIKSGQGVAKNLRIYFFIFGTYFFYFGKGDDLIIKRKRFSECFIIGYALLQRTIIEFLT